MSTYNGFNKINVNAGFSVSRNYSSSSKSHKNSSDFPTGIVIGVIVVIVIVVLFVISSKNQEGARERDKERFVASITKWIDAKETRNLSASTRKEIAECVYDSNEQILYYRSNLKREEDARNENRIISSSKYMAYGDFLTDLESYVNGGNGKIMQAEADMIDNAISSCKKKLNY